MWHNHDIELTYKINIDSIDVVNLESKLRNHDWTKQHLHRQGPLTGSYVIYYHHFDDGSYKEILAKTNPMPYDKDDIDLRELTMPILAQVQSFYPDYRFIKGEISICPGKEEQGWHRDPRVFHRFGHRIHVPIITNPGAKLHVENTSQHLEKYGVYLFNNLKLHRSVNDGNGLRVHVIVDMMPTKWWDILTSLYPESELYNWCRAVTKNPEERMSQIQQRKPAASLAQLLLELGDDFALNDPEYKNI